MSVEQGWRAWRHVRVMVMAGLAGAVMAGPAFAQPPAATEPATYGATEAIVGHAVFADDSPIHHSVFGVAAPFRLSPKVSVGPELLYMRGPGSDRDVALAGMARFDLISADRPHPPRVVPFLVAGGGLWFYSDEFVSVTEGYLSGGGGAKVFVTDRLYVAPEVQFAWQELHIRTVVRVGYRWKAARPASE
jgi:hypothetical protein